MGGGGGRAQLELTDALVIEFKGELPSFSVVIRLIYIIFTKTGSSKTIPGFENRSNIGQTTKRKALKRVKESKQKEMTVKQSLEGNVDRQFCSRGFAISPVI